MQDLELYKFECIFEQLKFFASLNSNTPMGANNPYEFVKLEPKFLQLLQAGMLQLEVWLLAMLFSFPSSLLLCICEYFPDY